MKLFLFYFFFLIKYSIIKFNNYLMSSKFKSNIKNLTSISTNYSKFLDTYKTFNLKTENSNINQSSFSEN